MNLCDSGWTARGATGLGTIVLTETSWICYPAWCTTTRIYRNQASMWRCKGYRIHQSRRLTRSWEAGLQGLAGKAPRKVAPDSQTAICESQSSGRPVEITSRDLGYQEHSP